MARQSKSFARCPSCHRCQVLVEKWDISHIGIVHTWIFAIKFARYFWKAINTLANQCVVNTWALRAQPSIYTTSRYLVLSLSCLGGAWCLSKAVIRPVKESCNFGPFRFRAASMTLQHGPWRGHKLTAGKLGYLILGVYTDSHRYVSIRVLSGKWMKVRCQQYSAKGMKRNPPCGAYRRK